MKINSGYYPPFMAWFVWLMAIILLMLHEVFIPRALTNTTIYWVYYSFSRVSISEVKVTKWMANILTLTDDYFWTSEEAHKAAFPNWKK